MSNLDCNACGSAAPISPTSPSSPAPATVVCCPSSVAGKVGGRAVHGQRRARSARRAADGQPRSVHRRHRRRRAAASGWVLPRISRVAREALHLKLVGRGSSLARVGRALGPRRARARRAASPCSAPRSAQWPTSASMKRASARWRANRCAFGSTARSTRPRSGSTCSSGTLGRLRARVEPSALRPGGAGRGNAADARRRGDPAARQRRATDFRDERRAARHAQRAGAGRVARVGPMVASPRRSA